MTGRFEFEVMTNFGISHDSKNVICALVKWGGAGWFFMQILLSFRRLFDYHACDNYTVRVDIVNVMVNLSAVVTASAFLLHLAFHAANTLLSRLREHA